MIESMQHLQQGSYAGLRGVQVPEMQQVSDSKMPDLQAHGKDIPLP